MSSVEFLPEEPFLRRDTSWLFFNHRVLQEAMDQSVPLYERLKFLAIYSSNLDEFFRVRVASLRSFKQLKKKDRKALLTVKPKSELKIIQSIVHEQQELFGKTFRKEVLPALAEEGVHLLQDTDYNEEQKAFAKAYFQNEILPLLELKSVKDEEEPPFLENRELYFIIAGSEEASEIQVLNIPSNKLPRFQVLPSDAFAVSFLDDIIRHNLPDYLGREDIETYSIKLDRDAELYIDDEYAGDLVEKIRTSLQERQVGLPTRFLYDSRMPSSLRKRIKNIFGLSKHDLIPGARYHNFNDFFGFPAPEDRADLKYPDLPPQAHPAFEQADNYFDLLDQGDQMLHFPYQRYDYVPQFIEQAAVDPSVKQIKITLYRVASKSAVVEGLLKACKAGKEVTVFVEAKARFDEESNLFWGGELEKVGANVRYSFPGIKVHTKLLMIGREVEGRLKYYTYLGTGNFNEKTARLYCDHALLTADQRLGRDTAQVFELLEGKLILPRCKHLLVAPFALRDQLIEKINREIKHARDGKPAAMTIKLNGLEEETMLSKLCEAAEAGVRVRMIVRGINGLRPGSDNCQGDLEVISILDRFLEHARVYHFYNQGKEELYTASADWMERNLHRRVEVGIPIYDPKIREELLHIINLQWRDNTKARIIDADHSNHYRPHPKDGPTYRAQIDIYEYLKSLL